MGFDVGVLGCGVGSLTAMRSAYLASSLISRCELDIWGDFVGIGVVGSGFLEENCGSIFSSMNLAAEKRSLSSLEFRVSKMTLAAFCLGESCQVSM